MFVYTQMHFKVESERASKRKKSSQYCVKRAAASTCAREGLHTGSAIVPNVLTTHLSVLFLLMVLLLRRCSSDVCCCALRTAHTRSGARKETNLERYLARCRKESVLAQLTIEDVFY